MSDLVLRTAQAHDVNAVLAFWRVAAEERFRILGGTRVDAMVLDDNEQAHRIWRTCGYRPQGEWSRWIKPL